MRDANGRFVKKNPKSHKGRTPWNKGIPQSDEAKRKNSEAHKGRTAWNKGLTGLKGTPHTEEQKRMMSEKFKGRCLRGSGYKHSEETRRKISEANKGNKSRLGQKLSDESKRKIGEANRIKMTGTKQSEETIKKRSEAMKGKNTYRRNQETRQKMSRAKQGQVLSDEHKNKLSEARVKRVGDKSPGWKGGISFEPYCSKFNKQLKEKIRDRDNRTCQLCNKKEDGTLLSIHHVSYDKPNCAPNLIALCRSCNCKVNFNRDYYESLFMQKLKERGLLAE